MDQELEETSTHRVTVARTVRFSSEMLSRLQTVADHLGVTVGAYMTQELGRAVCRDEVALSVKQTQTDSLGMLAKALDQLGKDA